jgi:hypothetical protein
MPRLTLRAFGYALVLSLLFGCLPVLAATSQPVLYSIGASAPKTLAQGAQKSWPITISEDSAMDAVFQGGMWLPTPSGGRVYAKYARHIVHANGIWTWVGTVETVHGAQQVVLTFGKDGVFGMIPQASGYPLRIVTSQGETRVVETSAAAMARSTQTLRLRSQRDYAIPPRIAPKGGQNTSMMRAAADAAVKQAAASPGPVTIDVMVVYSQGLASMLGSQRLALIRIQNLVDITNQAYAASGVNQRIRLVYTTEVSYPDNTSNQSALDDITGVDENGNPVSVPASLADIAALRTQYGADLVVMLRSYDNATQGDCGVGWLIGGGQATIVPSESNAYGYSVVSDGSNGGYYCLDTTFAHELGHNMGDAHDRANATLSGAYAYSYGYVGNGTNGFSTIMAYGTDTQTPLAVFSNPNISTCQNTPCGVADSSSSSADNAHSMNNTAALIAAFEPTTVVNPPPSPGSVHNDVNGDGTSDIIEYNPSPARLGWWLMNGTSVSSYNSQFFSAAYHVVATGDFNGDGRTDILWADSSHNIYVWLAQGGGFTSQFVGRNAAGWSVVGAGDVDGDGYADVLVYNPSPARLGWWRMNGSTVLSYHSQMVNSSWKFTTTGDFNDDGRVDIAWVDPANNVNLWTSGGSSFASNFVARNAAGWSVVGSGDIDGDGNADLLVYNPSPSRLGWWLMDGSKVLSYHSQYTAGSSWKFAAAGDFDGDGKTGIAWIVNGNSVYLWSGNGTLFTQAGPVGKYTPGWTVIP